jgi:mono/diheme cytochrome c family protein
LRRFLSMSALAFALAVACVAAARTLATQEGHGRTQTAINPAVTYSKNCATCHGKDGSAHTFKSKHHVHARDLTDARWQSEASDERILDSIRNGRGRMPAFKDKLTTEQITSLVSYVRELKR